MPASKEACNHGQPILCELRHASATLLSAGVDQDEDIFAAMTASRHARHLLTGNICVAAAAVGKVAHCLEVFVATSLYFRKSHHRSKPAMPGSHEHGQAQSLLSWLEQSWHAHSPALFGCVAAPAHDKLLQLVAMLPLVGNCHLNGALWVLLIVCH